MTDRTEDEEDPRRDTTPGIGQPIAVPSETDWALEIQVPFDEGEPHDLTSAIIVGVAEAEDVRPMAIKDPPLYHIVDVAALEAAFFGPSTIGRWDDTVRSVEFMFRGHRVVVRSDGWVQVYRPAEA